MARNILDLTSKEALDFFAKSEEYHSYELPEYIGFDDILAFVRKKLKNASYQESIASDPCKEADINMDLLINKDGRYGVRPLTLANPYLYWFLVKELCGPQGWKMTKECFKCYKVDNIESSAMPIVKDEDAKEDFHNAETILNWWHAFEQRTIELSLDYRYMFLTDITNCYGTIDPRTIEWAFNRKGTKHETDKYSEVACRVRSIIEALQNGRNIGIPQGSTIFNLLGEFILGYADLLFTEAVEAAYERGQIKSLDYRMLRYRDDYRILCNDRDDLKTMSYILQHVLESLNLRINPNKTRISESIVTDAVKPDKLYYIENTPIFNKTGCDFDGIQKYLMFILMLGRKYPNCGRINVLLTDLDKRVLEKLQPKKRKKRTLPELFEFGEDMERLAKDLEEFKKEMEEDLDSEGEDLASQLKDIEEFMNEDFSKEEQGKILARWSFKKHDKSQEESTEADQNSHEVEEEKEEVEEAGEKEDDKDYEWVRGKILEDPMAIASVGVQIAIENVQKVHYALRVVSRVVNSLDDEELKWKIFDKVCNKLKNRPNSDYDKIWLQNITYQRDKKNHTCPYDDVRLCQLVMGEKGIELWNNRWLKKEFTKGFPLDSVCDRDLLGKITPVITFRETRAQYDM